MLEGKHGNKRLIDANALEKDMRAYADNKAYCGHIELANGILKAVGRIDEAPTVDAVEVPCKIGDFVWAIRSFKGHKHPQRGIVNDMFFTKDMKLMIVVKYVARGEWGKVVFATDKEAYSAIGERKDEV